MVEFLAGDPQRLHELAAGGEPGALLVLCLRSLAMCWPSSTAKRPVTPRVPPASRSAARQCVRRRGAHARQGHDWCGRLALGQRAHDSFGKAGRRLDGAQHAPQFVFNVIHGNSSAVMSRAPIIFPRNAVNDRLM